ncbi:MAG: glycine betaine ABC transporter substrate-binding protein [Gemmataceae bacterium]
MNLIKRSLLPALVLAAWLSYPATASAQVVHIGSKAFTEQVILGEMMALLLRDAGMVAVHHADLGGTQVVYQALLAGQLDAYVEYTGTLTQEIFKDRRIRDEDGLRRELARAGVVLGGRLGFANNYALGVREDLADRLKLRSIGDLAAQPKLRIGLSDEFIGRNDGWVLVRKRYRLPHTPRGLRHELALNGLAAGKLDVTDVFTTDAEIRQYRLRLLEDDVGALPVQHAVLLYRADLDTRVPGASAALLRLIGQIDNDAMIEMNARVQVDRQGESRAATEFLVDRLKLDIPTEPESSRAAFLARVIASSTASHLLLVLGSLAIAVTIAVPLGVLAYRHRLARHAILGIVGALQTVPSMALLVALVPLLGLTAWPVLVALLLYSLLPIVRNTYNGLAEIPQNLRESAEVLGLPERARLWRVELPLASRSILAGIKTAAVINVGTATIGAIIGAGGYGQPIMTGIRLQDFGLVLAGAVPAAVMALLLQQAFGWLEPLLVPRGLRVS